MTPLRQKLIDEIQLPGFSPHTQDSYLRSVTGLARFYYRSPDQISDDEIKSWPGILFFVGSLFVPQLVSMPLAPHPLVSGFIKACCEVP